MFRCLVESRYFPIISKLVRTFQPSLPEVFDDGEVMTRISSQLVSTKLPVQGQKEVVPKQIEVAEEGRNVNKALCKLFSSDFCKPVFLVTSDALQPLCTSVTISDKDIYAQEDKGNG